MKEETFKEKKLRKEAFDRLKIFLKNPGRFCLMVLGSRGSGKCYAIKYAFGEIRKEIGSESNIKNLCLNKLHFVEADNIPSSIEAIDKFLESYINETIVIEDVENLEIEQQKLLFKVLSTENGLFGIKEKFKIRFVFTSSKNADSLREDGKYLIGLFWDRISQLIVEVPSYKQEPENIIPDFRATWEKMNFKELCEFKHLATFPRNADLEKFLEDNADKFEGGFRDLDKIACMYFNYRIYFYGDKKKIDEAVEKQIVLNVKNDFFGKSQMQENSGRDESIFQIRPGFSMEDLIGQFKIQVRNWAKKEYGTIAKAEEKLGLGKGTMKNYVEGKVTKSRKKKP